MNGEQKFWICIWLIVGLSISSVAWAISWYYVTSEARYIEAGYEKRLIPGTTVSQWVKGDSIEGVK